MTKQKYTYKLTWVIAGIVLWEVIFWSVYFVLVRAFGFFSNYGTSEQLVYKRPEALWALGLLFPVAGIFMYSLIRRNRITEGMSNGLARSFLRPVSSLSAFLKYFFFRNTLVFMVIAMALPVFGTRKVKGTAESMELVIALDISNSMNTCDIAPETSRLEVSKRALIQLINNLHGEKIGIVLFANSAFTQLPITQDYGAAKLFIDDIETDMISSQGTNIDAAIQTAVPMFSEGNVTRAILLITDGENHESDPTQTLASMKEKGIQLSVLGIGTAKGGLVPNNPKRPELGYKTNAVGKAVLSKLDPNFLRKIAAKGGGVATLSSEEFPNLSALLTEISQLKRTKIDTLDFDIKQERYQIPLLISLICLIAFLVWSSNYVRFLDGMIKK